MDVSDTIKAKSDQLNADDLFSGAITIKVTSVKRVGDEQPIAIHYEGDEGRPYKPCKSMRRILVSAWGANANEWIGQSMTLFRDPKVKWAGQEVGGIRISHMTGLSKKLIVSLTASKQSRKPYTVEPLKVEATTQDKTRALAKKMIAAINNADSVASLEELLESEEMSEIKSASEKAYNHVKGIYDERVKELTPSEEAHIEIYEEEEELPV